jgi:hypothetical protein
MSRHFPQTDKMESAKLELGQYEISRDTSTSLHGMPADSASFDQICIMRSLHKAIW